MARQALCVGINDYPGTGSDLAGCVNDANDRTAALKKRGFAVTTLLDRKAGRPSLVAAIRRLVAQAKPGETVVFTYAGHGSFVPDLDGDEPDGTDECLCPWDVARLGAKGPITDDELHAIYSTKAAGVRLIVISDSCHSGSVARFNSTTTAATTTRRTRPRARCASCRPRLSCRAARWRRSVCGAGFAARVLPAATRRC